MSAKAAERDSPTFFAFLRSIGRRSGRRERLRGLARVWLYFVCLSAIAGFFSVRHARAEVQDQTVLLGRQMLGLVRSGNHAITKITFNGQAMFLGSATTDEPPGAVLARYETYCQKNPSQSTYAPAGEWQPASATSAKPKDSADPQGLLRAGDDREGTVVCFVHGAASKPSTVEAMETLLKTGQLGALGDLRYVYATRGPSGGTLVLTAWTDATFNVLELVSDGRSDVRGSDFPDIPRPPGSVRVLATAADGTPYAMNVYKTTDAPERTLAFYDHEMRKRDFLMFDPEVTPDARDGRGRAYMKDGVVLTLATTVEPEGNFVALGIAGVIGSAGPAEASGAPTSALSAPTSALPLESRERTSEANEASEPTPAPAPSNPSNP